MRCKCIILNSILALSSLSILFLFLLLTIHLSPTTIHNPFIPVPSQQTFSLLIGILTRADLHSQRHFLRLVYGAQRTPPNVKIHVKFVFCRLTKVEQRALIALEILRFDDIIILNCTENMNFGKTYAFFSSLPKILPQQYDYVMKADDDVFIRLEGLSRSLKKLKRRDLYYGFVLPCTSYNPYSGYMAGMGFILSWDLVQWISVSDIPAQNQVGPEDKLVGQWLSMGNKGKNRVTEKPGMYDFPGTNGRCSHELIPETVAVHRLKRWDRWLQVLTFFNVTRVRSSKMYYFDK
ncbi:Hexosyltransferase [Rhynchospora pubera]|uniref:Hexosyltransferase n=1 Tax=Rhynchospora pubera TaxID=906938 RepID=A0AAV8ET61_9POAL|nr:Hexosyltransferase [Rhynchospora pubera]